VEKTLKVFEQELREQIAEEIEKSGSDIAFLWIAIGGRTPEAIDWYINDVKYFADTVRGIKSE
jgi:hypothetical protein